MLCCSDTVISQAAERRYFLLHIFKSVIHGKMSFDCFERQEDGESAYEDVPEKSCDDLSSLGLRGENPHDPSRLVENRSPSRTLSTIQKDLSVLS